MTKSSSKILFPGQQENERVCMITRSHWTVFAKRALVWLGFVVLSVLFDNFVAEIFPALQTDPYRPILNLLKAVYMMLLVAAIFALWALYYLNYQIITNQRIVDITQKNLLHHTTSELKYNRIQDVTAEIKGVWGNMFNYGNVYVQTAGTMGRFQFDLVPNPHGIAKLILDLYEQLPAEQKTQTNEE